MNQQLYNYLERRFYISNIPKYHKYFSIWIYNLTQDQLLYFNKEMINLTY